MDFLRLVSELFRSRLATAPVKDQYNRINLIFSENVVLLNQFWSGTTVFNQVLFETENLVQGDLFGSN